DPAPHVEPRCRLWVDRSGRVLKQESLMLGSKLVFVRRSDEAAVDLIEGMQPPAAGAAEAPGEPVGGGASS
ncbi:MAG: hypothetical protein EBX36_10030, partial [Planctomycetia bacterium]|nr:hypothetical protein [Planctomycetia bacterium]